MAKASDNIFARLILAMRTTNATTPSDSSWHLFAKANGVFAIASNGVAVGPFGSGSGGSGSITASGYTQTTARLLGRTTASTGAIEEITVGSGLSLSAGSLTATGSAGAVTLITDTLLGGDTATFDFTSIPGTYAHLRLKIQARTTESAGQTWIKLTFNNDTGSNYDGLQTQQYVGSTEAGFNEDLGATSCAHAFYACGDTAPTSEAAAVTMTIPNYASTTFFKQFVASGYLRLATGSGGVRHIGSGGNWRSTSAITRITLTPTTGSFKTGSRASLYGIS